MEIKFEGGVMNGKWMEVAELPPDTIWFTPDPFKGIGYEYERRDSTETHAVYVPRYAGEHNAII